MSDREFDMNSSCQNSLKTFIKCSGQNLRRKLQKLSTHNFNNVQNMMSLDISPDNSSASVSESGKYVTLKKAMLEACDPKEVANLEQALSGLEMVATDLLRNIILCLFF